MRPPPPPRRLPRPGASEPYDWTRFGRHRLRAIHAVVIDSPLGPAGHGWLATTWPAPETDAGWARLLWQFDGANGGWIIPGRLAGGDVVEFGADRADYPVRWYGIVDSYDAVEWLVIQGPYAGPWEAHEDAQQILAQMRYSSPIHARRRAQLCTRRRASHPPR